MSILIERIYLHFQQLIDHNQVFRSVLLATFEKCALLTTMIFVTHISFLTRAGGFAENVNQITEFLKCKI